MRTGPFPPDFPLKGPVVLHHQYVRLVGAALRKLPPAFKGKGRLARTLVPSVLRRLEQTCEVRGGSHFHLPNIQEPVGHFLWADGVYEPDLLALLLHRVRDCSAFLDIGANIGAFTVPVSRAMGADGRVLAIEASPFVLPFLRGNLDRNGLHSVCRAECFVGASEGEVDFFVPPADHFGMGSGAPQFGVAAHRVPSTTLDRLCESFQAGPKPLLKIDVEGFESQVFLGAEQLLTRSTDVFICFEFCDWAEERAFPGQKGLAQRILLDWGFRLWDLATYLEGGPTRTEVLTSGSWTLVAERVA